MNPEAGDVIPGSGVGKRGSVRVICFNRLYEGMLWRLLIYGKSARDNVPAHVPRTLHDALDHG